MCSQCYCPSDAFLRPPCYFWSYDKCIRCTAIGVSLGIFSSLAFVLIAIGLLFAYLYKFQTQLCSNLKRVKDLILDSGTLKILVTYLQITASLNNTWPEWALSKGLRYLGIVNLATAGLGLECLLPFMGDPYYNFLSHLLAIPGITIGLIILILLLRTTSPLVDCLTSILLGRRPSRTATMDDTNLYLSMGEGHGGSSSINQIYGREGSMATEPQLLTNITTISDDMRPQNTTFSGAMWRAVYIWVYALYFLYFELTNRSLAVFNCDEELITGRLYMQTMPWLECSE